MSALASAALGTLGSALGGGETAPARDRLGKHDFMKLLITQLQNQDPTQPQDPTRELAQLAQFSALEQMQELNKAFSSLLLLAGLTQSASLIGKNVTVSDGLGGTVSGTVKSVKMENQQPLLVIKDQTFPVSAVLSVG